MNRRVFPAVLGAVLAVAPAFVMAQAPSKHPCNSQRPLGPESAARSLMHCSRRRRPAAGWRRLNVSQIGIQRATDPELKRFSQQMVDDHSRMNQELVNLVAQKRIGIPQTIDARAQFCAESLAGLTGPEFDKCYAKAQLVMHMDAVAAFEAEAMRGQDPDIKALAAKALPKIKEHLHQIKPIAMRYEKEKNEDRSATQAGHTSENR